MNKFMTFVGVGLMGAALVLPATAAQAQSCENQAIWTYDGNSDVVKKWSPKGELLATIDVTINDPSDFAISSDLTKFYSVDYIADTDETVIVATDAVTGAEVSRNVVPDGSALTEGAGAGVIASGALLMDSGSIINAVDTTAWTMSQFADISNADASLPAELRGGSWSVAGDMVQLPGDAVLVIATNSTVTETGAVLVRVSTIDPTNAVVVGIVQSEQDIWGAARAGNDVFIATENGELRRLDDLGTTASTAPVATTTIVTGGGSFWGAAGSDDATAGVSDECASELASTGTSSTGFAGLAALALIAGAGAIALGRRKGAVA